MTVVTVLFSILLQNILWSSTSNRHVTLTLNWKKHYYELPSSLSLWRFRIYTVSQKNPCDYVFDDNLNSKRPIVIIFGTVIT